jgi:hypothetical protein
VLSTGVDAAYHDLSGSVISGPDYTGSGRFSGGPFWGDEGTAVAGLIAGHGHGPGDASGIIGIAPAARILSVRVTLEFNDPLNSDSGVTGRLTGAIAQGIRYAVDHGAKVIDLPLDPGSLVVTGTVDRAAAGGSAAESAAVRYAISKGAVLVAPAGDDAEGPGLVNFPAAYPGVIAVGAVMKNSALAPFSSRRSYITLTAPGAAMVTAKPPGDYSTISTTDLASAIVTGMAALIRSRFPLLTASQVTHALVQSTGRTRSGGGSGYGTVNAARAVQAATVLASSTSTSSGESGMSKPRHARTPQPSRAKATVATARRPAAAGLAGSVLKDAAIGTAVLMILLFSVILTARAKRQRRRTARLARSGTGGARGSAAHAAGTGSRRLAELRGHGVPAPEHAPGAGSPGGPGSSAGTGSLTNAGSLTGPVGRMLPANAGSGAGSGAGSSGLATRAGGVRPLLAPVPKPTAASSASRQPSRPPWDPAGMPSAEPESGPQPAQQPATAARPPWELDSPLAQESGTPAQSAWGPAGTEADGTPEPPQARAPREVPRLARGQAFEPGIGYAAAPVAAEVTDSRPGDVAPPPGFGGPQSAGTHSAGTQSTGTQSTGSMYVWNPAASTDVFPAIRLDANGAPIPPDEDQPGSTGTW